MSFLYPRQIMIRRPRATAIAGDAGYVGLGNTEEQPVAGPVKATIQPDTSGGAPLGQVPGDTTGRTLWRINVPAHALARDVVQPRDIVIDDLGQRYQVTTPYWNPMGYQLRVERLIA